MHYGAEHPFRKVVQFPIEKFVREAGSDRMLFGTDLPWFDPHQAIGVLLNADITDEDRHNICHRNAEQLLAPILGTSR